MDGSKLIDIYPLHVISHHKKLSEKDDYNNNNINYFTGSYADFFIKHLLSNTPCIIRDATKQWKCAASWVKDDKPDIDYLNFKYGNVEVPVSNCKEKYFNAQSKTCMKFSKFAEYWKQFIENDYQDSEPCFYLKDWHFTKDFPDESVYSVPLEFSSDWLNEYYAAHPELNDDYKFVYMGPKGSWTPLHADVFSSYSWSVNICGEKKWILLPPGEEEKMKNKFGELPYDICEKECDKFGVTYLTIIQKPGDALFVPSGWHHQVWNLMDTISINHNWINGCNIDKIWTSMKLNLQAVQNEISCFKDSMDNWHTHCQLILKSSFGMNFEDFYQFLSFILEDRKSFLNGKKLYRVYEGWIFCSNHLNFDYEKVKEAIKSFYSDENVKLLLKEKNMQTFSNYDNSV